MYNTLTGRFDGGCGGRESRSWGVKAFSGFLGYRGGNENKKKGEAGELTHLPEKVREYEGVCARGSDVKKKNHT
jgi:hypothetical protein